MVIKRKKTTIDGMDRDILRHMNLIKRNLTGNQIAKKVGLSPSALRPRLDNLKNKGIIKTMKHTGVRTFTRPFMTKKGIIQKKIKAPSSIFWGIDLAKPRKKKK